MASQIKEKCIEVCNELLRGEHSAIETYDQALEKYGKESEASVLKKIREDHQAAAQALKDNVLEMGGTPSTDSGAWGSFAKGVQGSAKLLGEGAAVWALKQGEEHGRAEYERALEDEDVLPECKEMIRNRLLPSQVRHISTLESVSS